MSTRWHVSEHDGVARKCTASPGKCPVSPSEADHHPSREQAQLSYETKQSAHLVPKKSRVRQSKSRMFSRGMIAVGTAAVTVVSLSACTTSLSGMDSNDTTGDSSYSAGSSTLEQRAREEAELLYNSGEPDQNEYSADFVDHSAEGIDHSKVDTSAPEDKEEASPVDPPVPADTVDTEPEPVATEAAPESETDSGFTLSPPWEWDIFKPSNSDGSSDPTSPSDINGIYFQGNALTPTEAEVTNAQKTLDTLVVMPEYTAGSYDREGDFGANTDESYAVTEQRDITHGTFKGGRAVGGHFIDPYTGETVEIVAGSSRDTNIEHIVPLHEAYKSQNPNAPLSSSAKQSITNDPANLQITGAAVNQEKGDKDAGQWMPSYEPSQCRYAIAVITVKSDYGLTMDTAEHNAVKDVLDNRCTTN